MLWHIAIHCTYIVVLDQIESWYLRQLRWKILENEFNPWLFKVGCSPETAFLRAVQQRHRRRCQRNNGRHFRQLERRPPGEHRVKRGPRKPQCQPGLLSPWPAKRDGQRLRLHPHLKLSQPADKRQLIADRLHADLVQVWPLMQSLSALSKKTLLIYQRAN